MSINVHHKRTSVTLKKLRNVILDLPAQPSSDEKSLLKEAKDIQDNFIDILSVPEPSVHVDVEKLAEDILTPEIAMDMQSAAFDGSNHMLKKAHEDPPWLATMVVTSFINQGTAPEKEQLNELHYYFSRYDDFTSKEQVRFLKGVYDSITENVLNKMAPNSTVLDEKNETTSKPETVSYSHNDLEDERIRSPKLQIKSLATLLIGCLLCITNIHMHDIEAKASRKMKPEYRLNHRRFVFEELTRKIIQVISHEVAYRDEMNSAGSKRFSKILDENPALLDTITVRLKDHHKKNPYADKPIRTG